MEPTQNEAGIQNAEPSKEETGKGWYVRFIKGDLGLAWTFWYHGMLTIFVLKIVGIFTFAIDHSGSLAFLVAVFTFAYLCTLLVAVWNAVQKYEGSQVWAILAVVIVVVAIANWGGALLGHLAHAGS